MALRKFGWLNANVWTVAASGDSLDPTVGGTGLTSVAQGALLYASTANTWAALANGTTGLALVAGATVPSYALLGLVGGGTGLNSNSKGDLLWADDDDSWAALPVGTAGQILAVGASDALEWTDPSGTLPQTLTSDAGSSTAILAPIYIKSSGEFGKAQANSLTTSIVYGLTLETIADNATGSVHVSAGEEITGTTTDWDAICGTTGGLTPGARYFLSAAAAGALVGTAPSSSGNVVFQVLVARSSTVARFEPLLIGVA